MLTIIFSNSSARESILEAILTCSPLSRPVNTLEPVTLKFCKSIVYVAIFHLFNQLHVIILNTDFSKNHSSGEVIVHKANKFFIGFFFNISGFIERNYLKIVRSG